MSLDAHVPRGASQRLVILEGYMFACVLVNVLLSEAEIDHVDDSMPIVGLSSNEEILRLHVAIDEVVRVDVLHALKLWGEKGEILD